MLPPAAKNKIHHSQINLLRQLISLNIQPPRKSDYNNIREQEPMNKLKLSICSEDSWDA